MKRKGYLDSFRLFWTSKKFAFWVIWWRAAKISNSKSDLFNPEIILADEPTGNLDKKNTELVSNLLLNFSKEKKISLVLVTHNINLAKMCDRVINLLDGQIKN